MDIDKIAKAIEIDAGRSLPDIRESLQDLAESEPNEGIKTAQKSLENGEGIPHEQVMAELDALVDDKSEQIDPNS